MSESVLRSIDSKLAVILRLLALNIVQDKTLNEKIYLLHNTGMTPAQIAILLDKTSNHIRVTLHSIKKTKNETGRNIIKNTN